MNNPLYAGSVAQFIQRKGVQPHSTLDHETVRVMRTWYEDGERLFSVTDGQRAPITAHEDELR